MCVYVGVCGRGCGCVCMWGGWVHVCGCAGGTYDSALRNSMTKAMASLDISPSTSARYE